MDRPVLPRSYRLGLRRGARVAGLTPDPDGTTVFERLNSPQELFHVKLGAALTMEQNVLEMLGNLEEEAQRQPLKEQFRHHADETRQQIQNIERPCRP
jgi:HEAT repeat protein